MQTNSKSWSCDNGDKDCYINGFTLAMGWFKRTQTNAFIATLLMLSFIIPSCRLDAVASAKLLLVWLSYKLTLNFIFEFKFKFGDMC